jgi:phosphate transport system substrate-binding protein
VKGFWALLILRNLVPVAGALALAACNGSNAREIRVVGSSTVYPFTTAVAETFVNQGGGRKAPVVESIGTGPGLKRFCEGAGWAFPDIANASRRIKKSEFELCAKNGVGEIIEVQIGVDGVALAESKSGPAMALTKKDIYLALAANPFGRPNAARMWRDVNPSLPAIPIQVMGPPSTSGTRDALVELVLEPGCAAADPEAKTLKAAKDTGPYDNRCKRIRDDGAYIDKGENDNLIVQGLAQNPNALGVFGYSYLEENAGRLRGAPIEGVAPSYQTIADATYPGARPLFLYIKKRHLRAVPGLSDFIALYATMWNPDGKLTARGLIAGTPEARAHAAQVVAQRIALSGEGLH